MRKKLEITERELGKFVGYLRREEREASTIESYMRTARRFAAWLGGRAVTKELAAEWKAHLLEQGYRPVSVNAMLAAVNKLFVCMGREDCKVRYLRLQRQMFRKSERELTRAEYQRLLDAAQARGDIRLLLLLETLCATGIRVSELQYITVEAARNGVAEIALKGKIRTILLPTKLCRKLLKYAKKARCRPRTDIPDEKGKRAVPEIHLGGDEKAVRGGEGSAEQGVPPQPAGAVRPDILRRLPGRGASGGRAGTQQHRDDPHLPAVHGKRKCPPAGQARSAQRVGIIIVLCPIDGSCGAAKPLGLDRGAENGNDWKSRFGKRRIGSLLSREMVVFA